MVERLLQQRVLLDSERALLQRHPLLCTRLGHDADARRTCVGTDYVVRGLDLCRSLQISAHGAHTQLLTRPPDYLRLLNQLNAVGFYADPTPPVWAIQPTLLHHYLGSYCATLIMIMITPAPALIMA